jgi:hypothetical protein
MGIHNQFRELKNEGVAEKLFRFQQRKMLRAAKAAGYETTENVEVLKGGACTAYALLWCRDQFEDYARKVLWYERKGGYQGAFPKASGGVEMFGARLQTLYEKEQHTFEVLGALRRLASAVGLDVDLANEEEFKDLDGLDDAMKYLSAKAGAGVYLLSTDLTGNGLRQAHALGVCKADAELFVFDPNCGEYRVKDADWFAYYLREAYQQHEGLVFDTCYVCPVYQRR